ncbi:MAG TPA: hypothetical protein DCG28_01645 [Lachnospiraceae bacterium]|nr:hypothetical protein [Lachnospiraceae bacterium]
MKRTVKLFIAAATLTILSCVSVYARSVRIGLEKNFYQSPSVEIADKGFELRVGDSKNYTMNLGSSVVKPLSKSYYDTGKKYASYNRAYDGMQQYIGNNCIPVLKDDGWHVYLAENCKADTSKMTHINTGGNCVVFSINGVNKYLVDGSGSAKVYGSDGIIDIAKGRYRGQIAFYRDEIGITPINILDVEEYLYGVVNSEMPSSWNIEALKAQAVAARTYTCASFGKEGVYDLCDTVHCQAYGGVDNETPESIAAVDATNGMEIYYDGMLINAVYFSSSGGVTQSSADAWGGSVDYLVSVPDNFETECMVWDRVLTKEELVKIPASKGYNIGVLKKLEATYTPNGYVKDLIFIGDKGDMAISNDSVRGAFSVLGQSLYSNNFKVHENEDGTYTLSGRGYGHGVGMSQYGAKGMAESGYGYVDILKHYYSGVTIE